MFYSQKICAKKTQNGQVGVQVDCKSPNGKSGFKGNKRCLPSKICAHCGLSMTWRKSWAKNWNDVKYCSDKCRAQSKIKI